MSSLRYRALPSRTRRSHRRAARRLAGVMPPTDTKRYRSGPVRRSRSSRADIRDALLRTAGRAGGLRDVPGCRCIEDVPGPRPDRSSSLTAVLRLRRTGGDVGAEPLSLGPPDEIEGCVQVPVEDQSAVRAAVGALGEPEADAHGSAARAS